MANPNPVLPTREQAAKGGTNSKRGKGKKTIARELLEQVASSDDSTRALEVMEQALAGRQGSALQVELIRQLFAASLEVAGQKDVARFKATQRNKELVLQAVLKHSSQKQAVELYKQLEAAEKGEEDEQTGEDQSNA
ncbi:hypothetical protein [Shewanella algae]|uniref:hypothetical protein n=1 Tax=Shewanella algae TaxID=38313 RepID=UPI001AADEF72|nr:hypothetical protein [Shewanella algae]MBO2600005.1 hypothetical protein [Shewanella algae]MBO2682792.1 hypothetical protein [Shewanella algae]